LESCVKSEIFRVSSHMLNQHGFSQVNRQARAVEHEEFNCRI
jgi:hypothetical protein